MVPTSVRQNKNRDSARSRSAPSDQRTLSCRIRNTAGFFSVERGTGRLGRAVCAPMRPRASAVSEVTATDALAVLTPIWHDKPETARRVRQRIGAGVRVPGPDGGAIRRSAPGDVGRNGLGRGRLDHPRRAHQGNTERDHRVPLSGRALAILRDVQRLSDGTGLVFPNPRGKPLSDATLSQLIKELGIAAVPHGFRSSFLRTREGAADEA